MVVRSADARPRLDMSNPTPPSTRIFPDATTASRALASEIATLLRSRASEGRPVVLGLATGGTPLPLYRELCRLHHEDKLSFRHVVTFNLDEYIGLGRHDAHSYWHFMQEHLFSHIDILPHNVHVPAGEASDLDQACRAYENAIAEAGGIDLQILGIGTNGHIGFNEPGSPADSRTHLVTLNEQTRRDNAIHFPDPADVPRRAITMGCGTILEARRIALLAWGARKAAVVRDALLGPVTSRLPASFLQNHPDATFWLDTAAASPHP